MVNSVHEKTPLVSNMVFLHIC